ncbi:HAMP domain-containing histidine kinase [bacterium]|nr:HAMP domain-containing histidine kinase [bacterium]
MTVVRTPRPPARGRVRDDSQAPGARHDARGRGDEWLAALAHELRSPLATVVYALEVVAGGRDLDPDARRACAVAEHQARRAAQLVDDLFTLCAASLDKLPLRKEVVDLAGVVAGATEATRHLLVARGHRLTVSLPPRPVVLEADPLRLEQVLTNLLANAAKFTDPGGHVRVRAEAWPGEVVVRVLDNGRGIAPGLLPQVFDLFCQGLSPGVGASGVGLGVGLALVKSLVERHGGTVTATSNGPGAGAEFVVRLPTRT